jgi:hypothetical protein
LPAGVEGPAGRFPIGEIEKAGYGAIWHGQKSWNGVAILARGTEPIETRRGLPGDPEDSQSRYIEAVIDGMVIACLYLPNGNPAPGSKFDYKLRWFQRLTDYAAELLALDVPVILAGDYNVMPTELDVYKPERWIDDALFRPEVREAFRSWLRKAGRMRCARSIPASASTLSGTISGTPGAAMPAFDSIMCCSVRWLRNGSPQPTSIATSVAGKRRATTRRSGSSFPIPRGPCDAGRVRSGTVLTSNFEELTKLLSERCGGFFSHMMAAGNR